MTARALLTGPLLATLLLLSACSRPPVQTYRQAREGAAPAAPQAAAMTLGAGSAGAHAADGSCCPTPGAESPAPAAATATAGHDCCAMAWRAPESWRPGRTSDLRKASFTVADPAGDCDLSVIALGGDAGGDLANVNRWREQLGLGPLAPADLTAATQVQALPFAEARLVTLLPATASEQGMLVGYFAYERQTWFIKLTGPSVAVANQRQPFLDFLQSFHLSHQTP